MKLYLTDDVYTQAGTKIAQLSASLDGDGKNPLVQTTGESTVIGFNDDGSPIFKKDEHDDKLIASSQQSFMATALKLQKIITKINGNDPSNVNIIH